MPASLRPFLPAPQDPNPPPGTRRSRRVAKKPWLGSGNGGVGEEGEGMVVMVDLTREEDREVVDVEAIVMGEVAVAGARVKREVDPHAMEEEDNDGHGHGDDGEATRGGYPEYLQKIGAVEDEEEEGGGDCVRVDNVNHLQGTGALEEGEALEGEWGGQFWAHLLLALLLTHQLLTPSPPPPPSPCRRAGRVLQHGVPGLGLRPF